MHSMKKEPEFEVEITNGGPKGYQTATSLALPASWAEFHDALQKARIEDGRSCEIEFLNIPQSELSKSDIGSVKNLYELNLFAQRLAMLTPDQKSGFEGLLWMERGMQPGPIPLRQLINLTFNTESCCIAPHVHNEKDLGVLLYEDEMLSDAATALLNESEAGSEFREQLLELLGKRHSEENGGVFTSYGYAEPDIRHWEEVYVPGEMTYFTRSGAPVVLEVSKGFFDDPDYDNDLTTILDLPASESAIDRAIETVDAADLDECGFSCVDCLIPTAKEWISDAIDDDGDLERANEFARHLDLREKIWGEDTFILYKALLQASGCSSLQDALELMDGLEQYELLPDAAEPWEYARIALQEKYPDLPTTLFDTGQGYQVGMELLERDHAAITDYGAIRRKDREPLPDFKQEQQTGGMQLE